MAHLKKWMEWRHQRFNHDATAAKKSNHIERSFDCKHHQQYLGRNIIITLLGIEQSY